MSDIPPTKLLAAKLQVSKAGHHQWQLLHVPPAYLAGTGAGGAEGQDSATAARNNGSAGANGALVTGGGGSKKKKAKKTGLVTDGCIVAVVDLRLLKPAVGSAGSGPVRLSKVQWAALFESKADKCVSLLADATVDRHVAKAQQGAAVGGGPAKGGKNARPEIELKFGGNFDFSDNDEDDEPEIAFDVN
jgi:hypothetical protein